MAIGNRSPFSLFDLAHTTGGRINQTHQNWCLALDGGRCNCAVPRSCFVRAPKGGRG
jgi:hypothetical protein